MSYLLGYACWINSIDIDLAKGTGETCTFYSL